MEMLNFDEKSNTTGLETGQNAGILVFDPTGKLKLARWRLQSDGHRVAYIQDLAAAEQCMAEEDIKIILVNVTGSGEGDLLKKLAGLKGDFEIIAVTAGNGGSVKNMISASGINVTISRPIDYPRLSVTVSKELENIFKRKSEDRSIRLLKRTVKLPLWMCDAYKTVLNNVKNAVMIADAGGFIRFANAPMVSLLRMKENSLRDVSFSQVMADIDCSVRRSLLELMQNTFEIRQPSVNTEVVLSAGTEEPIPFEAEAQPIFSKTGEFRGAFLIVVDVSNPRRLEKVMVQSEKLALVGQLAAGAAHEIRNPLTSVRGFIQLLQKELEGTPKAEYINIIIDEIDRVNTIINEFLKLAKPALPNRNPADLRELWEDLHLLVESEAFLKNINIVEDFDKTTPRVLIDCEQIKQVLINVIRNSFEAMAEGGSLTVRAYNLEKEGQVCLEISDTGQGMDEETVKRIFIPFFTTKDNGTGLGLAVSSAIMESHGGRMEIKSELDQGTTTYLYFPSA